MYVSLWVPSASIYIYLSELGYQVTGDRLITFKLKILGDRGPVALSPQLNFRRKLLNFKAQISSLV